MREDSESGPTTEAVGRRSNAPPSRDGWLVPALLIGSLAIAIRFIGLAQAPFWRDEAVRGFYARMSAAELVRSLQDDVNLPLFHFVLLAWAKCFGHGEFALRSLVAILGGLTSSVLVWALARPFGRSAGCIAGLVLAFSAGFILYSQELAVYALLVLLVTAAMGSFDRLVAYSSWPATAALSLTLAGMLYTHLWAALFWAALGIAVALLSVARLVRDRRLPPWFWKYVVAQAGAVVLFLPWLAISWRQAFSPWNEGLPRVESLWEVFSLSFGFWCANHIVAAALAVLGLLAFLIGAAFWFRVGRPLASSRPMALLLVLAFFFPLLASWCASPWKTIYYPRYSLICVPPMCAMIGIAVSRLKTRAERVIVVVLFIGVPIALSGFRALGLQSRLFAHSPLKALAQRITAEGRPGDVIVIYPEFYATTFNWYYRGDLPEVCYPAIGRVELPRWNSLRQRLADPQAPTIAARYVRDHLGPDGRIWVIYNPTYAGRRGEVDYGKSFEDLLWRLDMDLSFKKNTSHEYWTPHTFEFSSTGTVSRPTPAESREPVVLTICSP